MWVFWLADGIYSLSCCSALRLEHKSPGVYWNIHIWLYTTYTFGILVYLISSVSSHNWHLAWILKSREGNRDANKKSKEKRTWRMAFLSTKREKETLQLSQMISCPNLKMLCDLGVLSPKVNPDHCFLQIKKIWTTKVIYFKRMWWKRYEIHLHNLPTVSLWENSVTTLHIGFLVCKIGTDTYKTSLWFRTRSCNGYTLIKY